MTRWTGRKMRLALRTLILLSVVVSATLSGCGKYEKQLSHEMKVFALAYHNFAQGDGGLSVDEAGIAKIEWKGRSGPTSLEDLRIDETSIPELANRIRNGTFVVI